MRHSTARYFLIAPLSLALLGSTSLWNDDATSSSFAEQQEETQKKKKEKKEKKERKKKQRGKVVKATLVTTPSVEEAAAPAPAPAEVPATSEGATAQPISPATKELEPAPKPAPSVQTQQAPAATSTSRSVPVEESPTPTPTPTPTATPAVREAAEPVATPVDRRPSPRGPSADVVSERILVSEVLLDVLVTDKKGNVIEGLGPDDFVIHEEGVEKEVASVTFYGSPTELRGSGVGGEVRTDRYFLLFFHDQAQAFPSLMAAQLDTGRRARQWVESELLPNDQVAVLGYDVRLKLYQDFTRDKTLLDEAIRRAAVGKKEHDRGWREPDIPVSADSPSLSVNLPRGRELARQSRRLQQALALVGRASEGIVGRKNLLLFSVGFGDILDGGQWHPDPRYYPDMKESLNNGNVAVYSVDLLGSERGSPGQRQINDALSSISSDTGGFYYSLFTNALTPLRRVGEDNVGYYMLSYRSEYERGTAGYREVEVTTKDKSLKVRARKGYRYGDPLPGS